MINDLITAQDSYEYVNREIKTTMRRSASDAVRLGYLLRRMYDEQLWLERYDCLDEYLQRELHMDYSLATRFMNINKKYSVGGNSEEIADDWTGFSQSVLIEMLSMPPELAVMVTPDMTARQVREIKRQAAQKKEKTRIATSQLEEEAPADGEPEQPAHDMSQDIQNGSAAEEIPEAGAACQEPDCGEPGREEDSGQDEIPDAEFREVETSEEVATSQFTDSEKQVEEQQPQDLQLPGPAAAQPRVSLVAAKKVQQYLDDFAVYFVSCNYSWFRSDPRCRAMDLGLIPGEIKLFLKPGVRWWHFKFGDGVGQINLFDDYVQPWDENGVCLGNYDWCCLASAIRRAYLDVKYEKEVKGAQDAQEPPEEVATSQPERSAYGLEKTIYPEDSLIAEAGCGHKYNCFSCAQDCGIRQRYRYCIFASLGNPFECDRMEALEEIRAEAGERCQFINNDLAYHTAGTNEADPCCTNCKEECAFRCRRSCQMEADKQQKTSDSNMPEENQEDGIKDELAEMRRVLKEEQKTLDDYLAVDAEESLPTEMMFRQRAIVTALSEMIHRLEETGAEPDPDPEAEPEPEPEEKEQPSLPPLKNNDQRREWLRAYKAWGLWYRDENIGVDYYKYDFSNGARLIAEVYQEEATKYHDAYESFHLHLVGGPKPPEDKHGICRWQWHGRYSRYPNNETELAEFLKEVQKKG